MTGGRSDWSRLAGKGVYPHRHARWLLHPLRRLILSPEWFAKQLDAQPTDRVLEIGCGPGYFGPAIARRLSGGVLTLLDLQPEMIALARQRLAKHGADNVRFETGRAESLPFANAAFDRVYMVTVLGETTDPGAAIAEAARVLKPDGRLVVAEAAGDPDRMSARDLDALAANAGLSLQSRIAGWLVRIDVFAR